MAAVNHCAFVLLLLVAGSLPWTSSWADEPEPAVVPLSPAELFDKKVVGKATVEFVVGEIDELNIDSVFMPGKGHAQIIKAKLPGVKGDAEFIVIITRDVATALLKSGVTNVTDHFRNKQLRITGAITRLERPPGKTTCRLEVTKLGQLERVKAVEK
jgi:hypothetical protein